MTAVPNSNRCPQDSCLPLYSPGPCFITCSGDKAEFKFVVDNDWRGDASGQNFCATQDIAIVQGTSLTERSAQPSSTPSEAAGTYCASSVTRASASSTFIARIPCAAINSYYYMYRKRKHMPGLQHIHEHSWHLQSQPPNLPLPNPRFPSPPPPSPPNRQPPPNSPSLPRQWASKPPLRYACLWPTKQQVALHRTRYEC